MPTSSAVGEGNATSVEGADDAALAAELAGTSTTDNTSEGVKEPTSMLDAVQKALKPDAPAPDATKPDAESPNAETGEKGTETPAEEVDPYKGLPFASHPRFRQLLKSERTLKERATALEKEVTELKAAGGSQQEAVQRFSAFSQAVRSAGLEAKEVNDGFAIMAAMKTDPERALQMMQPYYDALIQVTGQGQFDPDLAKKVQDGLTDEETARSLQQERMRARRLEQQMQVQQQTSLQTQQEQQRQVHVNAVVSAVSEWEKAWQGSDPDYQKKQPLVTREINFLMSQEGYPADAKTATALADRARKNVEANLAGLLPPKPQVRTVTGGSTVATAAPKPKTMQDAIRLAAQGQYQPS